MRSNTYIDSSKEINNESHKFKISDIFRISKYKKFFAKGYTPNWSEDILVTKKVKNTMLLTYVINDLNEVEIVGMFYENELQKKTNQKDFRIEKVIRGKGDKLYIKWTRYNNLFNSRID